MSRIRTLDNANKNDQIEIEHVKAKNPKSGKDLLDKLNKMTKKETNQTGFVYCFSERSTPGYVKIGYYKYKEDAKNNKQRRLSPESPEFPVHGKDEAIEGLKQWSKQCLLEYISCAAHRMESLIHDTLHKKGRSVIRGHCIDKGCFKNHNEWFKTSAEEAKVIVKAWQRFSSLYPYSSTGGVNGWWHTYAFQRREVFKEMDSRVWVAQHLEALVTPLAEERRQSLIQIGRQIEAEKEEVRQKERAERVARREYKRADLELRDVDLENATSERKYPQGRLKESEERRKLLGETMPK